MRKVWGQIRKNDGIWETLRKVELLPGLWGCYAPGVRILGYKASLPINILIGLYIIFPHPVDSNTYKNGSRGFLVADYILSFLLHYKFAFDLLVYWSQVWNSTFVWSILEILWSLAFLDIISMINVVFLDPSPLKEVKKCVQPLQKSFNLHPKPNLIMFCALFQKLSRILRIHLNV